MPTAASLAAAALLFAALIAAPGSAWAAVASVLSVAALAATLLLPERTGARADAWAPWVLLAVLGALAARLGVPATGEVAGLGAAGAAGRAVEIAAVAGAAAAIAARRSVLVLASVALLELALLVTGGTGLTALGLALGAATAAWASVAHATARLRELRDLALREAERVPRADPVTTGQAGADAARPEAVAASDAVAPPLPSETPPPSRRPSPRPSPRPPAQPSAQPPAQPSAAAASTGSDAASVPSASGDDAEQAPPADLARSLELVRRAVRARSCVLFERLVDPPTWRLAVGASIAEGFDGTAVAPLGHGLISWAARQDMLLRLSEPGPQLRGLPWLGGADAGSLVALPLAAGPAGRPRGDDGAGAWAVLAVESPLARQFDEDAEELLALAAADLEQRIAAERELGARRGERELARRLPASAETVVAAAGVDGVARVALAEAGRLAGADAGAIVVVDAFAGRLLRDGGSTPIVLSAGGLDVESGHRLDENEETWATWAARHPDQAVRLAAWGPDRGLGRVARGDGLDASWSFAAFPLTDAEGSFGSLSLAWASRRVPGGAPIEAVAALAAAAGAALARELQREEVSRWRSLDALTGLPARSALWRRLERLAADDAPRVSLALFDVEASGSVLAEQGAEAWESLVEAAGRALRAALPAAAELHRWGGDEFAALLPDAGSDAALVAARRAVSMLSNATAEGRSLRLTVGVASDRGDEPTRLVARAEEALARARADGPGAVMSAES